MFYVGQKVVCINAKDTHSHPNNIQELTEGAIYTVRWVGSKEASEDGLGIKLVEVMRYVLSLSGERIREEDMPFDATRFRPLVEKKTDISIFTEMLNLKKVEEKV